MGKDFYRELDHEGKYRWIDTTPKEDNVKVVKEEVVEEEEVVDLVNIDEPVLHTKKSLRDLSPDELEVVGLAHGVDIDKRLSKTKLVNKVWELINADE